MVWRFQTPVALLIFNRPDTTRLVFDEIAKVKPPILLAVADGPRGHVIGEKDRCKKTRDILQRVDWPCKVLENFSDKNLGCKKRVATGVDWVFEQVPQAIILEDDCVPHPDFFRFCDELLEKYKDDERVSQISGSSFLFNRFEMRESYYFSKYQSVWGWASWRRAWSDYDVNMSKWPEYKANKKIEKIVHNKNMATFYRRRFDSVYSGNVDTWDYQWNFTNLIRGSCSIVPESNLISNIGFGVDATHTKFTHPLARLKKSGIKFPLRHPENIVTNDAFDEYVFERYINISKMKRIFMRFKKKSI